jgi:putative transcriptional regulator
MTNAPDRSEHERVYPWTLMTDAEWARLQAMTEEELVQNALDDPDNPPLTDYQLARMRKVPHPHEIRSQLGLTQREFAKTFEIALGTLRDWEQGARRPDSAAKAYLRVIQHDPDAVIAALAASRPSPAALQSTSELPKTGTG